MYQIIVDVAIFCCLIGTIFIVVGTYKRLFRNPIISKEPFLPLGIGLVCFGLSFLMFSSSFHNKEVIEEAIRLKVSIDQAKVSLRRNSFIVFIASIIFFYRASIYNDTLLENIHIFLKWLSKKTIPSIITTIIVAWLCSRLGFEIPSMTITSLTFGGITFAINASLSKNA